MRDDAESDWPDRILHTIGWVSAVDEDDLGRFGSAAGRATGGVLTDAELVALKSASRGMTSAETGVLVGVSTNAVRLRWRQAQRKLRAKNTTQACCEAIRQGLIP